MRVNAVFEGGGVRGIAFVGAISALEKSGYEWARVAGTSAGSIVAALIAGGYNANEIKGILEKLDCRQFQRENWLVKVPFVGKGLEMLWKLGLYSNEYVEEWLGTLLAKKGVRTFADIADGKLKVIASDISNGRMLVFPDDLPLYGVLPEKFPIAYAVRMSTCIPYFFEPIKWKTGPRRSVTYVIDGGIINNYPISIFDHQDRSEPTLGFRFTRDLIYGEATRINGPLSLYEAAFRTMLQTEDIRHINEEDAARTIFIPTGKITSTRFDLSHEEIQFLFASGKDAAVKFLSKQKTGTLPNKTIPQIEIRASGSKTF